MRLLAVILAACIVLLQWPLWIGKGSWLKVWQIESQLADQRTQNDKLQARNGALDAEVRDLKTGTDAIEERARNELGMLRQDEVFFQILDTKPTPPAPPESTPPDSAAPSEDAPAPAERRAVAPEADPVVPKPAAPKPAAPKPVEAPAAPHEAAQPAPVAEPATSTAERP
ncbi:cell division protein FtsB [Chitinimonas arctica]|uniref:Cell division protein FtsB n=1 Tax=Chitinimonas arctica TaxID=2594795 RepID=A0A516SAC4_9NEIS|nr:cell division protein FtsB [Chitinimonas arctica]QDQ25101.1 cell division protein FtsB [Chitinimonas arctica]